MTDTSGPKIEFRLEGDTKGDGLVLAEDFVAFLEGVLETLRSLEADRGRKPSIGYRIVDLEIGSAVVAIRAEAPDRAVADSVVTDFMEGFSSIRDNSFAKKPFSPQTRKAFQSLVRPLKQNHLRLVSAKAGAVGVEIRQSTVEVIRPAAEPDVHAMGALSGFIDAINVHREPVFFLYPEVGPARVRCLFDRTLLDEVRGALKKYVTVRGMIEYPEGSAFASRMTVEQIDVHPAVADLPSLESLLGSVPGLTGGAESVSYIRRFRDAEA